MNENQRSSTSAAQSELHWILRITPEQHRNRVTRIGLVLGAICSAIWTVAAFAGLFLGPFAFAVWRPDAPISQPVHWLRRVSGPDAFKLTYVISMSVIIAVVHTGHTFVESTNAKVRSA